MRNARCIEQRRHTGQIGQIERRAETAPIFAGQIVQVRGVQRIEGADLRVGGRERNSREAEKVGPIRTHLDEGQLEERIGKAVFEHRQVVAGSVS